MALFAALDTALAYAKAGSRKYGSDLLQQTVRPVVGAAAATAGAATLAALTGKITSEALTTAQNALYTLTLTNTEIEADDMVFVSVANGSNTQGTPVVSRVQPAAGSLVVIVNNLHASAQAFNGTIVISFHVVKDFD